MFKKIKVFLILLIFSFSVISCSKPSFNTISSSLKISKPSLDYYTKYLKHSISKKNNTTHLSILYTKTGKNKSIPVKDIDKFTTFLNSLKPSHFLNTNQKTLEVKDPEYRLTVFINSNPAFIINIFNYKYINIHPWDGIYNPDFIDISSLQTRTNIYNIVDFIIKNNIDTK